MNWLLIAQLVAQYGLPLAEAIWQKWQSGANPTAADWLELKRLGQQTPEQLALAAAAAAGIAPNDPRVQQLLALLALPSP